MPAPKVILFAGAPPASALDPESCTVDRLDDAFSAVLGVGHGPDSALPPPWRSLPLIRRPLRTGLSQAQNAHDFSLHGSADFFTTADVSFAPGSLPSRNEDAEATWTQFWEQSLAEHNSMPSSRPDDSSSDSDETSFMTTASSLLPPPQPLLLSDLQEIPPAARIMALQPQTVTLNLIVGVISLAQPRAVTTRWGQTLSLVEVLVGDNTATGFAVTFWLAMDSVMESNIVKLRRQDVVLMQNVALHVFRGKVYGQSLRKGLTRVSLLWRRDGSGYFSTRSLDKMEATRHPQQERTRLVRDWVLHFVGRDPTATGQGPRISWDKPPDDTQ